VLVLVLALSLQFVPSRRRPCPPACRFLTFTRTRHETHEDAMSFTTTTTTTTLETFGRGGTGV
jgi:hypothetical protein